MIDPQRNPGNPGKPGKPGQGQEGRKPDLPKPGGIGMNPPIDPIDIVPRPTTPVGSPVPPGPTGGPGARGNFTPLFGTGRQLAPNAKIVGKVNPNRVIRVSVLVKSSKDPNGSKAAGFAANVVKTSPKGRIHLSREAYASAYGLSPADLKRVAQFARKNRLRVIGKPNVGARLVTLSGTVRAFSRTFGVNLVRVKESSLNYRSFVGSLSIPIGFEDLIENVFNLETRPSATPKIQARNPHSPGALPSYNPNRVGQLYNFPSGTGQGQTVAIIELGGGARVRDLNHYFKSLGIKKPSIEFVGVAGGRNAPIGDPNSADGEVMLDIEVAGAIAPGAHFVMYFARNTNNGFMRAISRAVHDRKRSASIVSISWGGPEASYAAADLKAFNDVLQTAASMGVSIFVAAGDQGSTDGNPPSANVDFPGSSPWVTDCGGTRLIAGARGVSSETVWNDGPTGGATGGGISSTFPVPDWQKGVPLPPSANPGAGPGRGVPDVCGNADPYTGYNIRVDGVDAVVGGTSAVAPLWAGLCALINETLGQPLGFVNSLLYSMPVATAPGPPLNDITQGSNNNYPGQVQGYSAGPGWDACSGLGSPNGTALLNAIQSAG